MRCTPSPRRTQRDSLRPSPSHTRISKSHTLRSDLNHDIPKTRPLTNLARSRPFSPPRLTEFPTLPLQFEINFDKKIFRLKAIRKKVIKLNHHGVIYDIHFYHVPYPHRNYVELNQNGRHYVVDINDELTKKILNSYED